MPNALDKTFVIAALQEGDLALEGQFLRGSNYTFMGHLAFRGARLSVVYKPARGEQPLWDFPTGTLAKREVGAYLVSEGLGWGIVPPTIYRARGPLGPGSLQQYIEHDPDYHYFNFEEDDRQRLRPVMLFDILVNNADRKGSHILIDKSEKLWLIDHGLCFHTDDKLRTVIWDFAGESIPQHFLEEVRCFLTLTGPDTELYRELRRFLSQAEINAMIHRARSLVAAGCFPQPPRDRRTYPWPPV